MGGVAWVLPPGELSCACYWSHFCQ